MSQEEGLTPEVIAAVMSEEKANQREMFKVPIERIRKFLPNANAKQAEDYMIPRSNERVLDYSKVRRFGEDTFKMKIGGTAYEVSTYFNPNGRQCVFE